MQGEFPYQAVEAFAKAQGHEQLLADLNAKVDAQRVGADAEQPGVELLSAWYRRNLHICARLIQLSAPGDRVVLLFGAGHAFLLRQCVQETPGLRLAEPNEYLPK